MINSHARILFICVSLLLVLTGASQRLFAESISISWVCKANTSASGAESVISQVALIQNPGDPAKDPLPRFDYDYGLCAPGFRSVPDGLAATKAPVGTISSRKPTIFILMTMTDPEWTIFGGTISLEAGNCPIYRFGPPYVDFPAEFVGGPFYWLYAPCRSEPSQLRPAHG